MKIAAHPRVVEGCWHCKTPSCFCRPTVTGRQNPGLYTKQSQAPSSLVPRAGAARRLSPRPLGDEAGTPPRAGHPYAKSAQGAARPQTPRLQSSKYDDGWTAPQFCLVPVYLHSKMVNWDCPRDVHASSGRRCHFSSLRRLHEWVATNLPTVPL